MSRILSIALLALLPTAIGAARPRAGFTDVAGPLGLREHAAKRVMFTDLDSDGWLDVILDGTRVLRSDRGRRFVDVTERSGLGDGRVGPVLLQGDVDSDGDLDLLSIRYHEPDKPRPDPDRPGEPLLGPDGSPVPAETDDGTRTGTLLNDGTGRFSLLPGSGFDAYPEPTAAASFLDFDRDGRLDVFLGNWYRRYGFSLEAVPDRLLRGLGDGSFRDVTASAAFGERSEPGLVDSARPTYGVTAVDWNGDGWTDVLTASYGRQWNRLWENRADGTFVDRGADTAFDGDSVRSGTYPCIDRETEEEFRANGNTFDIATIDHDNDGDLDVYLGEITHWWAGPSSDLSSLLVNQGPGAGHAFERRLPPGLARRHEKPWRWNQGDIHVAWLDYDNDTRPDLLIASGDYPDGQYLRLHRQLEDGRFRDVTQELGLRWEGSGGVSIGDFDQDGDLDILVGRSLFRLSKDVRESLGPAPALFRNDVAGSGHWLIVRLAGAGPPSGASAHPIGASVRVTAGGVTQVRQLKSSLGHAGHQDAPELHFGLGSARHVDRLEIRWPDARGSVDVIEGLRADARVAVRQVVGGEPEIEARPRRAAVRRGTTTFP